MLAIVPAAAMTILLFQNCGGASPNATKATAPLIQRSLAQSVTSCEFNGITILDGDSVTAYLSSTSNAQGVCVRQTRSCNAGVLSGSYTFASCTVVTDRPCEFNGQQIAHGTSVNAYLNSSAPFGESCTQEARTCNNGVLSGSYTYGSCEVGQPAACMFNGQTIAHGTSVNAYRESSVAHGGTCAQESRTCNNGSLSGSFTFASCSVDGPASCMFDGKTIASGASVTAFKESTVAHGKKCEPQQRTCTNGALSGSYTYGSCTVNGPAACVFDGKTIPSGSKVRAYKVSTVAYGKKCTDAQDRVCKNGVLSGSYKYGSCAPAAPKACVFDGKTIPSGGSVKAYLWGRELPYLGCRAQQTRKCTNGKLSGNYKFSSCTPAGACMFNGKSVPSGSSVIAWKAPTAKVCAYQKRTCLAGVLMTGSYKYDSCTSK